MINQPFEKLIAYQHWAFEEVVSSINQQKVSLEKITNLINHLLGAENIWISRIKGLPMPNPIFPSITEPSAWIAMSKENSNLLKAILASDQINQTITYHDLKGNAYQSLVSDILIHLVNHSTYHRGQIAAKMREAGFIPASTDFINFSRLNIL